MPTDAARGLSNRARQLSLRHCFAVWAQRGSMDGDMCPRWKVLSLICDKSEANQPHSASARISGGLLSGRHKMTDVLKNCFPLTNIRPVCTFCECVCLLCVASLYFMGTVSVTHHISAIARPPAHCIHSCQALSVFSKGKVCLDSLLATVCTNIHQRFT